MSNHTESDRETLSALFDGELRGDNARFALKRLDHDAYWRDACGRWQLAGDVLRGQAMAPAPAGFAGRVAAALVAEPATAVAHSRPARGRWIGGAALAASVAVAALFVTRPFAPVEPAPSQALAGAEAMTAPAAVVESDPAGADSTGRLVAASPVVDDSGPGGAADPVAPAAGMALAGAAVAVADAPRRASRRSAADRYAGITVESPAADIPAGMPGTAVAALEPLPDASDAETIHPFLPSDEIASRPWPRAVLPTHRPGSAFTASFDRAAGPEAPSFYPFEPDRLGASTEPGDPGQAAWPQR